MTYADMFSKVKGMMMEADVSTVNEHLAYQFNITGEAEGIFYAEVKEGKLYVEPYEYYDRDAIFICSAETLFKINEGKLDPVLAVTLGKLKVEGNIDKALYLKKLIDSRKAEQNAIKKTQKQK
ncbi:MAG: SCP2 sterol-binding domain-containing protein [Mediterraneibacter faecis]